MRPSSNLIFAGNQHHRCLWRGVGGQRWTTLTSVLVVVRDLGAVAFDINLVSLLVLDDSNNGSKAELTWYDGVRNHEVEERCQPKNKNQRRILKMLDMQTVVIRALTGLHAKDCIHRSFKWDFVLRAITVLSMTLRKLFILVRKSFIQITDFICIVFFFKEFWNALAIPSLDVWPSTTAATSLLFFP